MLVLVFWDGLYCTWAERWVRGGIVLALETHPLRRVGVPPCVCGGAAGLVVERDGVVLEAAGSARRAGVRSGMSVAAARRLCRWTEVAFVRHDPFGVLPLVEAFRDACAGLTPAVEPLGERAVLLDLGARADPAESLSRLAGELQGRGALVVGAGAGRGVAVAAARLAGRLAAGGRGRGPGWLRAAGGEGADREGPPADSLRPWVLRRPGKDGRLPLYMVAVPGPAGSSFLAPWPLTLLTLPEGMAGSAEHGDGTTDLPCLAEEEVTALARLGVRTCGELLSLPRSLLAQAVGARRAARMAALCRGEAGPPVAALWPPPEVVWRSGEDVAAGTPLWQEAAIALAEGLKRRGEAASEFHLEWDGELGLRRVVRILDPPVREEGRIASVLAALADELAGEAAGEAGGGGAAGGWSSCSPALTGVFAVRARGLVPARPRQLTLEGGGPGREAGGREERLAQAVAALGARLGRCAVGWKGEGGPPAPGRSPQGAGGAWSSPAVRERRLEHWDPLRWRRLAPS